MSVSTLVGTPLESLFLQGLIVFFSFLELHSGARSGQSQSHLSCSQVDLSELVTLAGVGLAGRGASERSDLCRLTASMTTGPLPGFQRAMTRKRTSAIVARLRGVDLQRAGSISGIQFDQIRLGYVSKDVLKLWGHRSEL